MPIHDIIAYSNDGHPVLVVDVRPGKEDQPEQLERARQMLMHDAAPATYFLLAQRNGLFLWKADDAADAKPRFASVKSVLRDYAKSIADPEESLRKAGLEMIVYSWLDDLAFGLRKPQGNAEADQLLVTSGAYAGIRNGKVVSENLA